ncbi:exopolysaccharide biosynthesis polyprenyl glycosylphosphotransferase [Microbacterium laevaniformans OR221]|nr:exopolysaccharide biosynthesis polyprenyl glycosylphosphotransferase [Microbacterium laevaniformans OR221]
MSTDIQVDATTESPHDSTAPRADSGSITAPAGVSTQATSTMRPAAPPFNDWRRRFQRRLVVSDFLVLTWAVFGAQIAWFGFGNAQIAMRDDSRITDFSYWAFSILLIVLWMGALSWSDSRSYRVIGIGTSEYVRIAVSSFRLFGVIAIVAFLTRIDVARGFLLLSLPVGVAVLLWTRWLWRQWLLSKRRTGQWSARLLLVGSESSVAQIARELQRSPRSGYVVVGACVPHGKIADVIEGTNVPVMGSVNAVPSAMQAVNADTVAITSTDELPADKVKEISWGLEAGRQHLVLAPSIIDIAGPRLHTRPVAGLPLIHVETPRFTRGQLFVKRTFDIIAAAIFIVLLSPVLLIVTIAVSWTSIGPLLYKQERIGRNGEPFKMLKFRSMRVGADKELKALLEAQGTSEKPLFKIKDDPRITPVGKFIRKYSLDELPQLFNVLGGSMSLVGPRPQIAAEVALYTDAARRRLLARPGLTGLWQVSGRSSLDWEDAVRLDLYYVENWSLVSDLAILMKTAKAVVAPGESAH